MKQDINREKITIIYIKDRELQKIFKMTKIT